jgi:hypothetical protein
MNPTPKAVIHINFLPGELLFDARPIWSALNRAAELGNVPPSLPEKLGKRFGGTAIHLGTRDYIMRATIRELKAAILEMCNLVSNAVEVSSIPNTRVLTGTDAERVRDRVLLAIDSFLYEFRAFLELLAKFAYGFLTVISKQPSAKQQLSTGKAVTLATKKAGTLRSHDFLLYLCDKFQVPTNWYMFLSTHRNFFTHDAAPYCAIEDRLMVPAEYDLLIMCTNVLDFTAANPGDYFRVSECAAVVMGVRQLGSAVQKHLLDLLQ